MVVVVVVVDVMLTDVVLDMLENSLVAVRAASSNFSMDIGVVDDVGQPVNSVVALEQIRKELIPVILQSSLTQSYLVGHPL